MMEGNYYPVGAEDSGRKPAPKKRKTISQFKVMLIAVIILAAIILTSAAVWIINKILNPELIIILVEPSLDYDYIGACGEGLIWILKDEKCGLIDKYGNIVAPLIYDHIGYFDDFEIGDYFNCGAACVGQDGKYGLMDKTGNLITPLIYDNIGYFHEGLAAAGKDGKRGYIDNAGNVIIDFVYDAAFDFTEGLALVDIDTKKGFVNKKGEVVIPLIYDFAYYNEPGFKDGLAIIGIKGEKEETDNNIKWGVIDTKGKTVIPFEYNYLSYTGDGIFKISKDGADGFINKNGEEIIFDVPKGYGLTWWYFSEGLAVVEKDRKYGCMNMTGEIVMPLEYESISGFNNGLAIAKKGGFWGSIDKKGVEVIPFEYQRIIDYGYDDMLLARKSYLNENGDVYSKSGIINKNGEIIIPFIYDNVGPVFKNGLIRTGENGKYGLMDKSGEEMIPIIYDNIGMLDDEKIIWAQIGNKQGLLDMKGEIILPFEYDEIRRESYRDENLLFVTRDGLWGILEIKNK